MAALVLLTASAAATGARQGSADRSFGGGRVTYSFGPGLGAEGPAKVIALGNGRVFSGGPGAGNGWGLALHDRRGNPVGLGGDGLAYHQLSPGPDPSSYPADFARQGDGRWVGAGYVRETGQAAAAIARFGGDGTLDAGFGNDPPNPTADGVVRIDLPGTAEFAAGIAVDRAGRLLVSGRTGAASFGGPNDIFLARLRQDGSLDPSFGTGGITLADLGANDQGEDVVVLSSGRILVAGVSDGDLVLLRFRVNGTPDPSFGGGDGVAEAPGFGIESESGAELAVLPSGRILAGLNDGTAAGMAYDAVFGVARFTAAGRLDRSFSADGKQTVATGDDQFFAAMAVADDGRIVLSGRVRTGMDNDALIARLLPGGALDRSFGDGGLVLDHRDGVLQSGGGVAIQRDRRIVYGGDADDGVAADAFLRRLLGDTRRPGTRITAGPEGRTAPGRVRVRFRVLADVHARFECSIVRGVGMPRASALAFRRCSSPKTFRVAPGSYSFSVRAVDRAGNVDRTPARRSFFVLR